MGQSYEFACEGCGYFATVSGGDTDNGALFTSRILTSVTSLRLQDRDAFDSLAEAIISHAECHPQPSLLPDHASIA